MAADLFVPPFGLHRLPPPSAMSMSTAGLGSSPPPPPIFAHVPHPRPQHSPSMAMAAIASTTCSPMFPVLKLDKPVYSSPPPAASNPENNTCKLLEYRGAKVAAFSVDGRELICLPQAFELFLKHLVGGLHTVYTKLKRLDVCPIVCNVEQVRILRGLGAIQPGVNRCKLISPKEFDILYDDCTNNSARPGRPPKRSSISAMPDTLEKLKKQRFEGVGGEYGYSPNKWLDLKKSPLFGNGYHYPPHLAHLPFMPMGHPAIMNLAMANHLGMRPDGSPAFPMPHSQDPRHHPATAASSSSGPDMPSPRSREEKELERYHRERNNNNGSPADMGNGDKPLDLQTNKSLERRQSNTDRDSVVSTGSEGGMANGQLDLSNKPSSGVDHGDSSRYPRDGRSTAETPDNMDDMDADDESEDDKDEGLYDVSPMTSAAAAAVAAAAMMQSAAAASGRTSTSSADLPPPPPGHPAYHPAHHKAFAAPHPPPPHGSLRPPPPPGAQFLAPGAVEAAGAGLGSIETLLLNIQGLIKVAVENARHRDQQLSYEKAELKMEAAKEREMRETYEKQLFEEQKVKNMLQKRLRKERKVRKRLQEQVVVVGGGAGGDGGTPSNGTGTTDSPHNSSSASSNAQMMLSQAAQNGHSDQQVMEQQQQRRSSLDHDGLSQESDSEHSLASNDDLDDDVEEERKMPDCSSQSSIRNLMDTFLQTSSSSSQKSPPPPQLSTPNGYMHSPVIKQVETA